MDDFRTGFVQERCTSSKKQADFNTQAPSLFECASWYDEQGRELAQNANHSGLGVRPGCEDLLAIMSYCEFRANIDAGGQGEGYYAMFSESRHPPI